MTMPEASDSERQVTLAVSRTIRGDAATVFDMWTQPAHVQRWWGPRNVTCIDADIDLRVGGRYRIGNRLADGRVVWIAGMFQVVDRPRLLIYTWHVEPDAAGDERVTVRFETTDAGTHVTVLHERIPDETTRASHAHGWEGCLDGLVRYAAAVTGDLAR